MQLKITANVPVPEFDKDEMKIRITMLEKNLVLTTKTQLLKNMKQIKVTEV